MYGLTTDSKRRGNKKTRNIIKILFTLVIILIVTTPLTKLVFYFDNNSVYHHGPFLYVLYTIGLTSVVYVLYLKLTNKEEHSSFQIITNFAYTIALFSAFLYHLTHDSVLIELFAIDMGYLVMFISHNNPEQYLYKTIAVYNRHAFDEYIYHIVHMNRVFNILIITPKNSELYKKQFSSTEMFTLEKNIIYTINTLNCCSFWKIKSFKTRNRG